MASSKNIRRNRSRFNRRQLFVQSLERRQMLAGDWTNPIEPADANGDLSVTASDALLIINRLASQSSATLPVREFDDDGRIFPDVNGDGKVSASDALYTINQLHRSRGPVALPSMDGMLTPMRASSVDLSEVLNHVGGSVHLSIEADWASASAKTLPIVLSATAEEAVTSVTFTLTGDGIFSVGDQVVTIDGPIEAGQTVTASVNLPASGLGQGSVSIIASSTNVDDAVTSTVREDFFARNEASQWWASNSSPTDLHLWRLEQLVGAERVTTNQASRYAESIVGTMAGTQSIVVTPGAAQSAGLDVVTDGEGEAVSFIVGGMAQWVDASGSPHMIPDALVEIREADGASSTVLATTRTNARGIYSATITADDGDGEGNPDIFVRVYARSAAGDVRPDSPMAMTYFMDSNTVSEVAADASIAIDLIAGTIGVAPTADNDTAFGVHHAVEFISRYAGSLAGTAPSQIPVNFPAGGAGSTGSFFNGTSLNIAQLHRYDWDVIHHEYGHYFQATQGFVNSPGGRHSFGQNLAVTSAGPGTAPRGKAAGLGLAWSEGYATYFGITGQQRLNGASLGIPNVGDSAYTQTEGSPFSIDIENQFTPLGEDDELSVAMALYDLTDNVVDGVDEVAMTDRQIFNAIQSAAATTFGAGWEAIAASVDTEMKVAIGSVLGQNKIAPELTGPADQFVGDPASPPAFTWVANGGGTPNPLNDFRIRFYNEDFSSIVLEAEVGNALTFTPTAEQWSTVLAAGVTNWVIEGQNTSAPATPGGSLGRYWSGSRQIGAISIVFVIDDTGSMGEEIASVRNALDAFITSVEASTAADRAKPTIQLITFKDNVTTRITSNDLSAVRAAVNALRASGGGDCPEFSAHGLARAAMNVSDGGTILLATDASPQPGVDIGAVIADLRARGVTVNTILSGDCEPIDGGGGEGEFGSAEGEDEQTISALPAEAVTVVDVTSTDAETDSEATTPQEQLAAAIAERFRPSSSPGGFGVEPGDDSEELPLMPIDDPGREPSDDHGNTFDDSSVLPLDGSPIIGRVGTGDDTVDTFEIEIGMNQDIQISVLEESGNVDVLVEDADGNQLARFFGDSVVVTNPADGPVRVSVRPSGSGEAAYLVSADSDVDTLGELTSAVEVFSTVSASTGGTFLVRDEINSGDASAYESALLNIFNTTLGPTTLSATPSSIPRGSSLSVLVRGSNTNWRTGLTTFDFEGDDVTIDGVEILGPTRARLNITVAASAMLESLDIVATTTLGVTTETANGVGVVTIDEAIDDATLLSVDADDIAPGASQTITLRGVMTEWTADSVVTAGSGVTVSDVTIVSPTTITATVAVDPGASIGFRPITVSTGSDSETLERALFVAETETAVPSIATIDITNGLAGDTLTIELTGQNTNFIDGTTMATFGSGINVDSVTVTGPTTAIVSITIAADADNGFRSVRLTTNDEEAVLISGFFVGETEAEPPVVPPVMPPVTPPTGTGRGNVRVDFRGGHDLVIETRDRGVNFTVTQAVDGRVTVAGIGGTTVNGSLMVSGFADDDLFLRLRGGDAIASINGMNIGDDLDVDLDGGGNDLTINNVQVRDYSRLDIGGAGGRTDDVMISNSRFGDDLVIDTRRGTTVVDVMTVEIRDDFYYYGDDGVDDLFINTVAIGDDAVIKLDRGNDFVVVDTMSVGDDLLVDGGRGNDQILFTNILVSDFMRIRGNDGDDMIAVTSSRLDDLSIHGDDGDDQIAARDLVLGDDLRVWGNDDHDDITLEDLLVDDHLTIDGGSGFDRVTTIGDIVAEHVRARRIEAEGGPAMA